MQCAYTPASFSGIIDWTVLKGMCNYFSSRSKKLATVKSSDKPSGIEGADNEKDRKRVVERERERLCCQGSVIC